MTTAASLEVLVDPGSVGALEAEWWDLVGRAADANLYLTPAWALAWWQAFGGGPWRRGASSRLHVVTIRRSGRLVGLAPLLEARAVPGPLGARVLVGIGQENADLGGILVDRDDPDALGVVCEHLAGELGRGRTVLDLTRLPVGSPLLEALSRHLGSRHRVHEDEAEAYPVLDLRRLEDADRDVGRLLKRNDVLRRRRRLAEVGTPAWISHRPGRSDQDLDAFLRLHDLRWAGRAPSGPFTSVPGRAFLRDAARRLDAAGMLRLSFITLDGAAVVGRFGAVFDGSYLGMKSGWNPDFARFGPGHLVVGALVEQLRSEGLDRFEFLRGAGEHKAAWANAEQPVRYHTISRAGALGDLDHRQTWLALGLRYRWRDRPVAPSLAAAPAELAP